MAGYFLTCILFNRPQSLERGFLSFGHTSDPRNVHPFVEAVGAESFETHSTLTSQSLMVSSSLLLAKIRPLRLKQTDLTPLV